MLFQLRTLKHWHFWQGWHETDEGYTESVPGAVATGWYARLWRAVKGTIKVNARHARGVRTDPLHDLQSCQNYQLVLPALFGSVHLSCNDVRQALACRSLATNLKFVGHDADW